MSARGNRKEVVGTVISDKMQKTVIVETRRHVRHPQYQKVMVRRSKFVAHNEDDKAKMGDVVRLRESRPLSRTKRWSVVEIVRKGSGVEMLPDAVSKPKARETRKDASP